jgi:hypothetical protein
MSRTHVSVTSPWKSPYAAPIAAGKGGRPKKVAAATPRGCAWPMGPTTCGSPVAPGLAVCPGHAAVLDQRPGKECAWPSCAQSGFEACCTYHDKLVRGLLKPQR